MAGTRERFSCTASLRPDEVLRGSEWVGERSERVVVGRSGSGVSFAGPWWVWLGWNGESWVVDGGGGSHWLRVGRRES